MAHCFPRAAGAAAAVLLSLLILPRAAFATQLVLANGDRLTGRVIKQEKGLVYFHSDILGDIIAPANQVTIVETPKTATPTESMVGLPPMPSKGGAAPAPAPAGTASSPAPAPSVPSPVASAPPAAAVPLVPPTAPVAPAATVAAQPPAGAAAPLPAKPRHRVVVSSPLPAKPGAAPAASWWWPWWVARPFLVLEPVVTHWIGKIEFGYDNNLTTTRAVTTTTRLEADRISGPDNFQFKGVYLYGRSDLTATTDQDELDFRWRHNLDSRLFTEATTTYSQDKIRLINDNLEQEGSFGYKVFANQRQVVDFGVGLIGQYLDATGVEQGAAYFGHIFQDYTYKINGRYTFTQDVSADFSPERRARFGVSSIGTPVNSSAQDYDYKFHSTLEGKITDHLSLNLHFEYDYDNAVLDPHARAEQHVTTTLGYAF